MTETIIEYEISENNQDDIEVTSNIEVSENNQDDFEVVTSVEISENNLVAKIKRHIDRKPLDYQGYEDLFYTLSKNINVIDIKWLDEKIRENILKFDGEDLERMYLLHRRVVLLNAPYDFDSFMLYMEWNREPDKRFYLPRRKELYNTVQDIQDLVDGKLDILCLSMPPGVGKSTLAIFLLAFLSGKYPDEPMLTGSHSSAIIRGMYEEVLRMTDPNGDYLWNEIFPEVQVVKTNAKDLRIDMGKPKRFETIQFTSTGSGNAGLYRAKRLLYCDDLVPSREVALSKDRLDKLWGIYTTDLRQRKIGDHCGELHIATRWSVHDVIGRLEREYADNPRAKFVVMPALDDKDESNFDYKYGVGFNTKFYHEQRDIMDELDWKALYMNQPIEREGLLYHKDELRRFFELPDREPDAIISVCDTKDKGKDYASMPIGWVYGSDYYIADVLFSNAMPDVLDDLMVDKLVTNKVQMSRFESNSAGGRVAQVVHKGVKERGGITDITTKFTTSNKETKIIVNSKWIKDHCLFLDESMYKPNSEYGKFIDFLTSYTVVGKNQFDDAPDSMAMFSEFAQSLMSAKVEIMERLW